METIQEKFSLCLKELNKTQRKCVKQIIQYLNILKENENERIKYLVKKITKYIYNFLKNINVQYQSIKDIDTKKKSILFEHEMMKSDKSKSKTLLFEDDMMIKKNKMLDDPAFDFINNTKVTEIYNKDDKDMPYMLFNELLKNYLLEILHLEPKYEKIITDTKDNMDTLFKV